MSDGSTRPTLRIEFAGRAFSVAPGDRPTFGRTAELVIDDNRFLHRVLGEFYFDSGLWWLANVGTAIAISIHDDRSPSLSRLAPGCSMPIAFDSSRIRFEAGSASYEIIVDLVGGIGSDTAIGSEEVAHDPASPGTDDSDDLAEMTTTTADLPLTDDQFALLRALAIPLLTGAGSVPTNRQLASGLGWTITKWNRKLDGLCSKYAAAGVPGLHGSSDQLAKDRRSRLAEHVVHAGIVRFEHLDQA